MNDQARPGISYRSTPAGRRRRMAAKILNRRNLTGRDGRSDHRPVCRPRAYALPGKAAVLGEPGGCHHVRHGRSCSRPCRLAGNLHSSSPRPASRSDDRTALRMKRSGRGSSRSRTMPASGLCVHPKTTSHSTFGDTPSCTTVCHVEACEGLVRARTLARHLGRVSQLSGRPSVKRSGAQRSPVGITSSAGSQRRPPASSC
jgi:hypothetical protein